MGSDGPVRLYGSVGEFECSECNDGFVKRDNKMFLEFPSE